MLVDEEDPQDHESSISCSSLLDEVTYGFSVVMAGLQILWCIHHCLLYVQRAKIHNLHLEHVLQSVKDYLRCITGMCVRTECPPGFSLQPYFVCQE